MHIYNYQSKLREEVSKHLSVLPVACIISDYASDFDTFVTFSVREISEFYKKAIADNLSLKVTCIFKKRQFTYERDIKGFSTLTISNMEALELLILQFSLKKAGLPTLGLTCNIPRKIIPSYYKLQNIRR